MREVAMELRWHGNATLELRAGSTLIVDPFLGRAAGTGLSLGDASAADAFALTHGHFDHAGDALAVLRHAPRPLWAGAAIAARLRRRGGASALDALPGEVVRAGELELVAHPAGHVRFDRPLVRRTLRAALLHPRRRQVWRLPAHLAEHARNPVGECLAWEVRGGGAVALALGSLGLDPAVAYPRGVDALLLAYQGSSWLDALALDAVTALAPRAVVLHHLDDAYPPISSAVDPGPFVEAMGRKLPRVPVIVPERGRWYRIGR